MKLFGNMMLLAGTAVLTSACATIVEGRHQIVTVETPLAEGAACELKDNVEHVWKINGTPGSVEVTRGDGPMLVTCTKEGYEKESIAVDETIEAMAVGNVLLGGGVGIVIDAVSGAGQTYPDKITVWMKPEKWESETQKTEWMAAKAKYEEEQEAKKKKEEKNVYDKKK